MSQTIDSKQRGQCERAVRDATSALADVGMLPAVSAQGAPMPSQQQVEEIVMLCRQLLFPGFFASEVVTESNVDYHIGVAADCLASVLPRQIAAGLRFENCGESHASLMRQAMDKTIAFIGQLPEMRRVLMADVQATFDGDPAATTAAEVIFSYPGIRATVSHRIAHALARLEVPVIPRMIAEMAHSETGIDIHPGAEIGEGLMIDHGTGVVVGATAIIGRNVKLYQGVTLGARSFVRDADNNPVKGLPRHPVVGNDVVIYSNTTVLGRVTIGDGAVVGGNLWLTESVAPGEMLVQARPDNIVRITKHKTKTGKQQPHTR